ncbi:katanin-interacting protein-like isoform X2 [Tubulanus polymorphus]|uniref:katanin-interacting protein-like isoform X2 n=1 Tax=Tubulanus polymorphus TaxID=672921 RepID=UPI003DA335DD
MTSINKKDVEYDTYLLLLQEKNRIVKKLSKDIKQMELEKKEQGFTLYVNGANTTLKSRPKKVLNTVKENERAKTSCLQQENIQKPVINDESLRVKTAPENNRRNWAQHSLQLRTDFGEKMIVNAPDILTGNYSEDFDALDESYGASKNDSDKEPLTTLRTSLITNDTTHQRMTSDFVPSCMHQLKNVPQESGDDVSSSSIDEDIGSGSLPFTGDDVWKSKDMIVLEFAPKDLSGKHFYSAKANRMSQFHTDSNEHSKAVLHAVETENDNVRRMTRSNLKVSSVAVSVATSLPHATETNAFKSQVGAQSSETFYEFNDNQKRRVCKAEVTHFDDFHRFSSLSDHDREKVVARVLEMRPSQQKKLLKELDMIEKIALSLTKPDDVLLSDHKKTASSLHSSLMPLKISQCEDHSVIEVNMKVISNWGHPKRLGLTEIQFIDMDNRRLQIKPEDIIVYGAIDSNGDIGSLINGKFKTTKDCNMWSCATDPNRPLEFFFTLRKHDDTIADLALSKMKIWNYNRNLNDLCLGIKDVLIFVSGELVYDGQIEKGCGNQVYDYHQAIDLQGIIQPNSKKTDIVVYDYDGSDDVESEIASVCGKSKIYQTAKPQWLCSTDLKDPLLLAPSSFENKSLQLTTDLDTWQNQGREDLPTVLDKSSPDNRGECASQLESTGTEDETGETWTPTSMFDRAEINLEESWTSLHEFDKHQRGRISVDMEGDVMDEYLSKSSVSKNMNDESISEDNWADNDDFVIPELPTGSELLINIRSTWGDKHYVGLTGIELFNSLGKPIYIKKVFANPADINVLQGYDKDPRVVGNLFDGVNRTRDDTHMWLAPYTKDKNHIITIYFEKCKIAFVRIWNYNKSRIHSYRGAKDIEIALDNKLIFKGEITKACGGISGTPKSFGDTILFTTDETILEAVSKYDNTYEGEGYSLDDEIQLHTARPKTADDGLEGRPFTTALSRGETTDSKTDIVRQIIQADDCNVYKGQRLKLNFTDTWGDMHYLGLTGLEVIGKNGIKLPLSLSLIDANPCDLTHLPGCEDDVRTLDKLIDGHNITTSDDHMWLIPYTKGSHHFVDINFGKLVCISGIRIWNYNKSAEDSYRGAKLMRIFLDGKEVSPKDGFLIRKAPGSSYFDFAQEVNFSQNCQASTITSYRKQANENQPSTRLNTIVKKTADYDCIPVPRGFIYQFHLISSWGDPYYIGLNGLEFFDEHGEKIGIENKNISAFPDSINVLEEECNDVRTPDKLIDGFNETIDGSHMWLAPILPNVINRVYVIFDQPVSVSMIKLWNYGKTSSRGVKDFGLYVDDLLVYNGTLDRVNPFAQGTLPTAYVSQGYHTILFTSNQEIQQNDNSKQDLQDVQMTNDKKVVAHFMDFGSSQPKKAIDQSLRPTTSVTRATSNGQQLGK